MATSGSKNFTYTRNDIIAKAYQKTGEFDPGETLSAEEIADAALSLNLLIQEFTVEGGNIWLRQELTLFAQKSQSKYTISLTGDHVTSSYLETTLSAAEASGQTELSVTAVTGMVASNNIGIKVDDGSIHWSTISSIGGSTVTIASGLDDDAASGNAVYFYTTKAYRPHSILSDAILRRNSSGIDSSITLVGEEEYYSLTNKTQTGVATQAFYKAERDSGSLYLWPTGDGVVDKHVFVANYYPDDFDSTSDNADFPVEWGSALIYGLAAELGMELSIPWRRQRMLDGRAMQKLQAVLDFDVENADVSFARDFRE